jgi:phospholipid/cholesterol/gamma-HCH transport system substrate-binding protein
MNTESQHKIKLGIFVIAGSLLLILGLYMIGKNKNIFGRTITITAYFDNISGLQPGNNVRYSGIDIGTVDGVRILNDSTIEVSMNIKDEMVEIVRMNSFASIGTDGLMGNKLINIDPGTADAPKIEDGSTIPSIKSVDTEKMLRTLESTNLNVEHITANLIEITNNINQSRGTLYTMLMDTSLATSLHSTLANIEDISVNINHFSYGLSQMSTDIRKGKGAIGALVNDTGAVAENLTATMEHLHHSSEKIDVAATQLNDLLTSLKNGNGPAGALISDSIMAGQLRRSITYIDSSAMNFNMNMEALKQSFLTRRYFKNKEKSK